MMNLIRNIRYRRQLAEIAYHQRRCDEIDNTIYAVEMFGRNRPNPEKDDFLSKMSAMRAHHRYMFEKLKAQINGGAE